MARRAKQKRGREQTTLERIVSMIRFIVVLPKSLYLSREKSITSFMGRRPHRSFRLTRRRDYVRGWEMPGYWSFTNQVRVILWRYKTLFATVIIVHALMTALIVGIMSQETFSVLNDTVKDIRHNVLQVDVGDTVQNISIASGVVAGAFTAPLSEAQQIYAGFIAILGWLVVVWLLRQIMAGHRTVRFRDGLYNAGAPIVPTFMLCLLVLLQLIPLSIAILAYVAADAVMAFEDAWFTTLFWIFDISLVLLSLYWLTSSLIALVVVTLPGIYPWRAVRAAGDLVIGRRIRILYRYAWLIGFLLVIWVIALLPAIILANLINIEWLPIVPVAVLLLSSFSLVWSAAYIYLLYRKLVEDDASPV
jgi:hypothetical protein